MYVRLIYITIKYNLKFDIILIVYISFVRIENIIGN